MRRRGGIDSRTDFSGMGLSDVDIARSLQAEEFNPNPSHISSESKLDVSELKLYESQAQTRNANNLRRRAEESLRHEQNKPKPAAVYHTEYDISPSYDRIYQWSMGLIPSYSLDRRIRLQHLLEKLIRDRLYSNEPEYLVKNEIRRLFEEEKSRAPRKSPARRKAKSSKKKAPARKKAKSSKSSKTKKRK